MLGRLIIVRNATLCMLSFEWRGYITIPALRFGWDCWEMRVGSSHKSLSTPACFRQNAAKTHEIRTHAQRKDFRLIPLPYKGTPSGLFRSRSYQDIEKEIHFFNNSSSSCRLSLAGICSGSINPLQHLTNLQRCDNYFGTRILITQRPSRLGCSSRQDRVA